MSNILVAFFSVTGRTRKEADRIAAEKDADLIENTAAHSRDFSRE